MNGYLRRKVEEANSKDGVKKNFNLLEIDRNLCSADTKKNREKGESSESVLFLDAYMKDLWEGRTIHQNKTQSTSSGVWGGRKGEWIGLKTENGSLDRKFVRSNQSKFTDIANKLDHKHRSSQSLDELQFDSTPRVRDVHQPTIPSPYNTLSSSVKIGASPNASTVFKDHRPFVYSEKCSNPLSMQHARGDSKWVGRRPDGSVYSGSGESCVWIGKKDQWQGRRSADNEKSDFSHETLLNYLHGLLSKHSAKVAAGLLGFHVFE